MITYVIFVSEKDLDQTVEVNTPAYYKTLTGMVRNYYGNSNKQGKFTRSYGYIQLTTETVKTANMADVINSLSKQLPAGHTEFSIPVVIDTTDKGFILPPTILDDLDKLEKDLQQVNSNFKFKLLKTNSEYRLEPV